MESMELLHEILAAEKKARTSCDNARRENGAAENTDALRRQADEEAMEAARREVEAAEAEAIASVEDALREEERRCRETMEAMATRYAENRDTCAERMFRIAVGLE